MRLQEFTSSLLQETIYYQKAPGGLRVYLMPKKYNAFYAVYATQYGSMDSKFVVPGEKEPLEVPDGIAHFLEHKMFEKEWGAVFDKFAQLGASANAFTSYEMTAYLFGCTDNFEDNLELLLDFVQTPYFTDETVEKEKGIIEQELRMYLDNPNRVLYQSLLESLYHSNPVRKDIGGTVESVQKITKELLYNCYRTFYHPSNMILFAVGNFDPEAVFDQVYRNLERLALDEQPPIKRVYPEEDASLRTKYVKNELDVSRPRYLLGYKDPVVGLRGRALMERELGVSLLLGVALGRSSVLYNKLYDAGLIDDSFSTSYMVSPSYGHIMIGGNTPDPERLHQELLAGLREFHSAGINEDDFERVKRSAIGQFVGSFNSIESVANNFIYAQFNGIWLLDYLPVMENLTLEQVRGLLTEFADEKQVAVSVVYPHGSE
ncbi:MAG: pitrilysin family protein [Limnochordia bacterium]|nr:insulinase family protein [Limnochordia bacterium]MDD2628866.1 pitrilysin family protein [Limnochordia bacterium]MDD4517003.1 pitrilysin family protein [Limnochordia bacterium]